jgi:alpha-amylase
MAGTIQMPSSRPTEIKPGSEFGNWAATSAGQLTIEGTGANAAWSRTFSLPPSTAIQYKFVKSGSGAAVWESNQATASGNREAVTPACGTLTTLDAGSFKS